MTEVPTPADLARLERLRWERENGMVLSLHARQRMAEMGISRDQVVKLVNDPDISRPGHKRDGIHGTDTATISTRQDLPDWAAVWVPEGDTKIVLSLVFRTDEPYVREGASYRPR